MAPRIFIGGNDDSFNGSLRVLFVPLHHRGCAPRLRKHASHYFAVYVSKPIITTLEPICELRVIDSQEM